MLQNVLKINIAKPYNPMTRELFQDKLDGFILLRIFTLQQAYRWSFLLDPADYQSHIDFHS